MSITRIWDAVKINEAIKCFLKTEDIVDPIDWLANPTNIVLENELGDMCLFEYAFTDKTVYSGHYFFKSRGRQAIVSSRNFLDELFNSGYNVNVLLGMVPLTNKAARWITRQIGFKSYGYEEVRGTEYELFIMTKKEFNNG